MNALRLARYTKTPLNFFLGLPADEFIAWIEEVRKEQKAEQAEYDKALKKKGK